MDHKEKLAQERKQLDQIDRQLVELVEKRMAISRNVAEIKRNGNIALTDEAREKEVIERAVANGAPELKGEISVFMRSLIGISKLAQRKFLFDQAEEVLLPPPRKPLDGDIQIAYQGTAGAWGEQAALQIFGDIRRSALESFEAVFSAVKKKEVEYGVVPIENSQTGAIGEVYDLLRKYGCYIVGQKWVQVRHCLMGVKGAKIEDIREVMSHPEGFRQCRLFLKDRAWDQTVCRNTAVAAETVAGKGEKRLAAIGSRRAAELNGLEVLVEDISSDSSNQTRFIVIADTPEYDQASRYVSVIFRTAHRSGALCEVLFPLMAEGVNLTRIESRPMSGGQYCFFTDIEGNLNDPAVAQALRQAASCCEYLEVLGCYGE